MTDLFETEWDIAYMAGKDNERERILNIIKKYSGKPDFTFNNLVYLIESVQHPPVEFRDKSNGE